MRDAGTSQMQHDLTQGSISKRLLGMAAFCHFVAQAFAGANFPDRVARNPQGGFRRMSISHRTLPLGAHTAESPAAVPPHLSSRE